MPGRRFPIPVWLTLVALTCAAAPPTGCATGGDPLAHPEHRLSGTDQQQAERLFAQLQAAAAEGRTGSVLDIAGSLFDHHPDFLRNDEAYALAVQAALAKPDPALAARLAAEFQARHPQSIMLPSTLLAVGAATGAPAAATGGGIPETSPGTGRGGVPAAQSPDVDPGLIGVLAPLTGPDAGLGNAFVEGAVLAVQRAGSEAARRFRVQAADTGGDPVQSALAARGLCRPQGCLAVVGALGSAQTVAAALVADRYGVPLLSPTAAHDRIGELGPGIFQTNLTDAQEIEALVELGVRVLLKTRYAVLAPETPDGRRLAALFRERVNALDAQIVAVEFFHTDAVDFQPQIQAIRRARAEVVFVPASVDQAALAGPQLDYYRCGSLVMGPSDWNDPRLLDLAGGSLERAIVPDAKSWFPAEWTRDFERVWDAQTYPGEAAAVALVSYQATRLLLDTIAESDAWDRQAVRLALKQRLENGIAGPVDPGNLSARVNVVTDGAMRPFPADLFTSPPDSSSNTGADR